MEVAPGIDDYAMNCMIAIIASRYFLSNNQQLDCLLNSLFRLTISTTPKISISGLLWGESIDGRWFPLTKDPPCRKGVSFFHMPVFNPRFMELDLKKQNCLSSTISTMSVGRPSWGGQGVSRRKAVYWLYLVAHDDVIKWKHFPRYWPFHRSPVNSPRKGQWRGALMFSLICVWINSLVNNREAGDLRLYRAHYDVTVMNARATKGGFLSTWYAPLWCIHFTFISVAWIPHQMLTYSEENYMVLN